MEDILAAKNVPEWFHTRQSLLKNKKIDTLAMCEFDDASGIAHIWNE